MGEGPRIDIASNPTPIQVLFSYFICWHMIKKEFEIDKRKTIHPLFQNAMSISFFCNSFSVCSVLFYKKFFFDFLMLG